MKKNLTIFFLIASLILILDSANIWKILLEFFFIGVIPGSDKRFEPNLMLMFLSSISGIVIGNFLVLPIIKRHNPILKINKN